ncbi:MAG: ArsR family transcriptional regulator [Verrucomicrobia bacterium]|nr:ArsR family transcriptional regulator [Verrucomicrobiota bacterium]
MKSTLRVTKALADLQRVRILMLLQSGELCVCQIIEVLALAPSTISKHLSVLSVAGLVDSRKDGRWAYYRLPGGIAAAFVRPVLKWLCDTLENDDTIKQDMKKLREVVSCDPESLCRRQRERG